MKNNEIVEFVLANKQQEYAVFSTNYCSTIRYKDRTWYENCLQIYTTAGALNTTHNEK